VLGDALSAHFTFKDTSRTLLNTQNLDLLTYTDLQLADIAVATQLYALIV
jgi:tryptophanyl-tRNA synthetase